MALRTILPLSVTHGHTFEIAVGSTEGQQRIHSFFIENQGFIQMDTPYHSWLNFQSLYAYHRDGYNTHRIHVHAYNNNEGLYRDIFEARNSAVMNWISGHGIFIGYPGLLSRLIVAHVSDFVA
jgi:hypothetical protein